MKNLWSETESEAAVAASNGDSDIARQAYATRLLGAERNLVLHGGGNTSVKTLVKDLHGDLVEVISIKGSGRDMAKVNPEDLPLLHMEPLRRLEDLKTLSDADMVSALKSAKLDASAPNPSVETLLHVFLPARFIDHTHANAVLALTNHSNWDEVCAEAFGDEVIVLPYAMSGFALAKAAAAAMREKPAAEALVLLRHGIFTVGDQAGHAYERMIEYVSRAETMVLKTGRKTFPAADLPVGLAPVADVAPVLRGATVFVENAEEETHKPFLLDFRTNKAILNFVNAQDLERYARESAGTPDFIIHTKQHPLVVVPPQADKLADFKEAVTAAVETYVTNYRAYFVRNNARIGGGKIELDPMPRVILVPGLGLFGLGRTVKEAAIAADLAEANVEIISAAEALGTFESISEEDAFDIEYWSLEQAKLSRHPEPALARKVCVVTGGASGIGLATARMFANRGCAVALLDLDEEAARKAADTFGALGLGCDVTDAGAVRAAFDRVCEAFGGIDIVVSNAGAAWQGRIGDVEDGLLRKSFELNFWGHQNVAQAGVRVMTAQGIGGCLLFNTSKQALNPGKNFGPYGLPKAATLFLMKQYALDHGHDGIRSNAVNADRIRSGLLTDDMVRSRSEARGVTEKDYLAGNLLGREVTADDVARGFVHLALSPKTTAATLTVDGGNIEASLR